MQQSIINGTSLIEKMRAGRRTAEAIFIKFTNNNRFYRTHAFCFYEGEDGKYYDPRIRMKFEDKFISYAVGNKKEVLKLLSKINAENIYNDVCTMFFIDRDFDESLWGTDENLFETQGYSIENFYSQTECFKQILQSEFGLSVGDVDYDKCLSDFCKRLEEFNYCLLEFNALVLCRRLKSNSNSDCSFNDIKTSHLANVSITGITKAVQYEDKIQSIKSTVEIADDWLEQVKGQLEELGDFGINFRGKNQLDFFVGIVMSLKELNSKRLYFDIPLNCVHINITVNRLSELSQYAITPSRLTEFLNTHYQKMVS